MMGSGGQPCLPYQHCQWGRGGLTGRVTETQGVGRGRDRGLSPVERASRWDKITNHKKGRQGTVQSGGVRGGLGSGGGRANQDREGNERKGEVMAGGLPMV